LRLVNHCTKPLSLATAFFWLSGTNC
jgi:hypothetical protein